LWAVSSDGASIVFHHRNWRAPKSGKYPNGVHLYALGGQRRMLYGADSVHSTRSVQASVNATPQGQFPADILPFFKSRPPAPGEANDFSNHLVWALRVTGEVFPLALLGGDPLHAAAFEGRAEACLTLIRNGAAVETQTYWGFTPLDLAVNQDHEETALRLLEHGALPNTRNSAFHRAVAIGRMTLIEAMLARGASVHATDTLGETALHAAVRAATRGVRGWDFFEELASPRVMMDKNITPQVIRLLLRHGADPGQPNRDGLRPVDLLTPNPSASAAWQSYQEGIRAALAGQSASSPVRR
jgi:hypothetical protein